MKTFYLTLIMFLGVSTISLSQLPDGPIAPDFTLTDRDGVEHNLYTYLDQGKAVFVKFFACHCPTCWNYHNTGKLESLYQTYGPDGTDQIMVMMLEHDVNNPEAFTGGGTYTQGDWTAGNTIPMFDVEGSDRSVFDDYNVSSYPWVIKICPDKLVELMSTNMSTQDLWDEANACTGNLSIESQNFNGKIYYDAFHKQMNYLGFDQVSNITIFNIAGQKVLDVNPENKSIVDVTALSKGMFVIQISHAQGLTSKKFVVY